MTLPETASSRWAAAEGLPFPLGQNRVGANSPALFTVATPSIDNEIPAIKLAVAEKHIVLGSFHAGRDGSSALYWGALRNLVSSEC